MAKMLNTLDDKGLLKECMQLIFISKLPLSMKIKNNYMQRSVPNFGEKDIQASKGLIIHKLSNKN